ncbi:MAG: hypothetical protein ACYDBB_23150 [Armatimonadota bacterium]
MVIINRTIIAAVHRQARGSEKTGEHGGDMGTTGDSHYHVRSRRY